MSTTRKNAGWALYFGIVFLLAIAATATLITFNIKQQLTPEQFEAGHKKWREKGPKNFVMVYKTLKNDEANPDHFVVKVRNGKTYEVLANGLPLPEERFAYYGMDRLYDDIERFMEQDAEKDRPKVFTRGLFDKQGAIRWYVRRVMGSRERLEITIEPLDVK
ncbi:MAG: DUF6174 domain-containing protein [Gemmataceae bacterium]